MADKKISALTGASTPLAGTEVLPIVQSGATVKVAVSDLTAGRAVSASSLTTTGNVGIGTSPTVKLDVSSTYVSDTAVQQRFYDNTGGALNFGGTGGANKFIQVQDTTTATYYPLLLNPLGGDVKVGANLVISTSGKGVTTGSSIPLGFGVNGSTSQVTIDTSGNLLVGTTTSVTGSNHVVVGSNAIQGIKKDFTNLGTSAQTFNFSASNAGVYVANLKSVGGASVAFLIACTFDNSSINMFTTSLGGCTAGGTTGTITGINGDARIYTFTRNGGDGLLYVSASSTATGTTSIYLTPLNVFA
jgi:hypothetical protein